MSDRENVRRIFDEALGRPGDRRRAYVEAACAGDAELRGEVESLLAASEQAASAFLPSLDSQETCDAADPVREGPGSRIGRYKLLEKIGEGGFGVVYMAEQDQPVRRRVALKIIKPGMDTRQVIARFEAERQALALMEHVNIAQVFDAGATDSGLPYFVMELVKGLPITAYCDQARLPLRQRLQLFACVCRAIQHAHYKGVIHRDLKPGNILVTVHDGQPVVKVIDFGIAKAIGQELTDKTLFTGFSQILGTPLYGSPEQVALSGLDIDTRTDVYSLGVLLYELLTGTTPFEKERLRQAACDEMRRIIREEDPPRPSVRITHLSGQTSTLAIQLAIPSRRLAQTFRGELDWIVMKALEKERGRRYETPLAFANDIERYLSNEAITARPPSTLYRVSKFVRRHAFGSAFAATALLLLGLGTTLVWNEKRKTDAALVHTQEALSDVQVQRKLAGDRELEAQHQADRALRAEKLATERLSDVQAAAKRAEEALSDAQVQRKLAGDRELEAQHQADRALRAEKLATDRLSDAQAAADQERQAREKAVRAEHRVVAQLVDNYTSRGLDASTTWNAQAALWFAKAAVIGPEDPDRIRANMMRVNNWMYNQWTPVAAFKQVRDASDHAEFNPVNSRYLLTFRRYEQDDVPPQLWDLATAKALSIPPALEPMADAVWTSDGRMLLGSQKGKVALVSFPEMKILHQWDAGGPVRRVAVTADGRAVAASVGTTLLAWAVSGPSAPAAFDQHVDIAHIAFSPNGEQLLTASDKESTARVFSIHFKEPQKPALQLAFEPVTHVYRAGDKWFTMPPLFVAGGRELFVVHEAGSAPTVRFYDATSGAVLATTKDSTFQVIRSPAEAPDGRTMAIGGALYDLPTHKVVQNIGNTLEAAFSAKGDYLVKSEDGIQTYKMAQGKATRVFPNLTGRRPAISNDGKYLAVLGSNLIQIWRFPSERSDAVARLRFDGGNSNVAFSKDGRFVAPVGSVNWASAVRNIQLLSTDSGAPVGRPIALNALLVSADVSPDGQLIAAVTGPNRDRYVLRLWNWQSGSLVWEPLELEAEPVWTRFAPDGKALAVHFRNGLALLIDAATRRELLRVQCKEMRKVPEARPYASGRGTIGFSQDGRTLYTWGSRTVQAWDRATGRERFAFKLESDCWSLEESPDGRIVAAASYAGLLHLNDATDGHPIREPIENPGQILAFAFSPDGKLICTTSNDHQTRVWEIATGKLLSGMRSGSWPSDARFLRDGQLLAIASASGLQLWDFQTGLATSPVIGPGTGSFPSLEVSADGHRAVIAGNSASFNMIHLDQYAVVASGTPDEALLWCELLSNARIEGSTLINLSESEWLERWQKYRESRPDRLRNEFSPSPPAER